MSRSEFGQCTHCGACCHMQRLPPFQAPEELADCDAGVRAIVEAMLLLHGADPAEEGLPCYFWNERTGLCRIYEQRPSVCREFPAGSEACRAVRAKFGRGGQQGGLPDGTGLRPDRRASPR